ncbi:MAG: hypothetical protein LQ350_002808 [Teloschistes chrysophthalmus]|nr:MAG: hypothetical protein LQ350_002808 [Niorma chrysophthalma]
MAFTHAKITATGFKAGIGFMLAVAVSLAFGRLYIRTRLNQKTHVDDGLFIAAVLFLIAGTVLTYIDIPYIYLQQNVQAGTEAPPADFIQQLLKSVKIQDAAVVLLSGTILAVKLCFLALFRSLIRRLRKLEMWWWLVLAIVVPSSIMLVCSNFISCSYFDERILGELILGVQCLVPADDKAIAVKCVTSSALKRQNDTLKAVTILDIISDAFIISIPIALLWRVQIDMRRKIGLTTMLCLSVFTIITAIVRISGGNTVDGQVDSSWVIFWLQMEAAVAVMAASVAAYRALFVSERSQKPAGSPQYTSSSRFAANFRRRRSGSKETKTSISLPTLPAPTLTSMRTKTHQTPYDEERLMRPSGEYEMSPRDPF